VKLYRKPRPNHSLEESQLVALLLIVKDKIISAALISPESVGRVYSPRSHCRVERTCRITLDLVGKICGNVKINDTAFDSDDGCYFVELCTYFSVSCTSTCARGVAL
jgi:hypothetical protein